MFDDEGSHVLDMWKAAGQYDRIIKVVYVTNELAFDSHYRPPLGFKADIKNEGV